MATKIEIWNQALGAVGTRIVASEDERTPEAIQCGLFWDTARKTTLRDFPWAFAQTRTELAEMSVPAVYVGEWAHAYAYPVNCLKLHRVHPPQDCTSRLPHNVTTGVDGLRIILSDVCGAQADYTKDVPTVSRWDDDFAFCMAKKLAAFICVPLLKGPSRLNELETLYQMSLPQAKASDASEKKTRLEPDSWLLSRGAYSHDS